MADISFTYDEKLKSLLNCPVCGSEFDTHSNVPRILPCLSTICTSCISNHLHEDSLTCPNKTCTRSHKARTKAPKYFPEDVSTLLISSRLQLRQKREKEDVGWCEKCERERKSEIYCSTCDDVFCHQCIKHHKNSKLSRGHISVNIDDILNLAGHMEEGKTFAFCTKTGHESFPLDKYCLGKACNTAICKRCEEQHSDTMSHRIKNLEDVGLKFKQEIIHLSIDLESNENQLYIKNKEIEKELAKKEHILNEVEKEIEKSAIGQGKEKWKDIANKRMTSKSKHIEQDQETTRNSLDLITSIRRSAKDSMMYKSMDKILEDGENIKRQLKVLKKTTIHAYPSTSLEMTFYPGHLKYGEHAKDSEMLLSTNAFPPFTSIEISEEVCVNENIEMQVVLKNYKKEVIKEPYLDVEAGISQNGTGCSIKCVPRGNCFVGDFVTNFAGKHKLYVWAVKRRVLLGSIAFNVEPSIEEDTSNRRSRESDDTAISTLLYSPTQVNFVRLNYGLHAFPKIRHLQREFGVLTESLRSFLDIIKLTVKNDFTTRLEETFQKHSNKQQNDNGYISVPTESLFVWKDVLRNSAVNSLSINFIGTENQADLIKKLISPNVEPQTTEECGTENHKRGLWSSVKQASGLRSPLYDSPVVYMCWVPETFDHNVQQQLSGIFSKLDKKEQAGIIFVTESDNILELQTVLKETYFSDFESSEVPIVCYASAENVRRLATFSLSEYIFGRLTVMKEILLSCQENTRSIQSSQRDICINCISSTIENIDIPRKDESRDCATGISDFDFKCQYLCKMLEKKVFHVNSLLKENPRPVKEDVHKIIPDELVNQLSRLNVRGVEAFGLWSDEFRVYINGQKLTEEQIKLVETEVRELIPAEFTSVQFIHCKGPLIVKFIEKGDKLFQEASDHYGTLGIFARDRSAKLIALTSEHVVQKDEKLFVENEKERMELGVCHMQTTLGGGDRHASNISLIKISPEHHPKCTTEFKNEDGDVLEPKLYEGPNERLKDNIVYKKGASTNWTSGGIRGKVNTCNGISYVIVDGFGGGSFSKGGDSGSVVFMYDKKDAENTKIYLVSMVQAGGDLSGKEGALTYRLDEPLSTLQEEHRLRFDI